MYKQIPVIPWLNDVGGHNRNNYDIISSLSNIQKLWEERGSPYRSEHVHFSVPSLHLLYCALPLAYQLLPLLMSCPKLFSSFIQLNLLQNSFPFIHCHKVTQEKHGGEAVENILSFESGSLGLGIPLCFTLNRFEQQCYIQEALDIDYASLWGTRVEADKVFVYFCVPKKHWSWKKKEHTLADSNLLWDKISTRVTLAKRSHICDIMNLNWGRMKFSS